MKRVQIGILLLILFSCQKKNLNQASIDEWQEIKREMLESGYPYSNSLNAKKGFQLLSSFPEDVILDKRYEYFVELLNAGQSQSCIEQIESHLSAVYKIDDFNDMNSIQIKASNRKYFSLLALSYLRQSELDNCISNHVAESCIFPLEGRAIHKNKKYSIQAYHLYKLLIDFDHTDYEARWLINIAAMASGNYDPNSSYLLSDSLFSSDLNFPRFINEAAKYHMDVLSGAGSTSMEDFNNDGHLDIFCSGYGFDESCQIFISDGKGGYRERTDEMMLRGISKSLNFIHADFDNDGWIDILLLRGAWLKGYGKLPLALLKNIDGKYFLDITKESGLNIREPTQTAAFSDIDLDGDLDLFVGYECLPGTRVPSMLYLNDGNGHFTDQTVALGIKVFGFVKAAVFDDFTNDGYPDLYLSIMGESNRLYINELGIDNSSKFVDKSVEYQIQEPIWSFPVMTLDIDNNGWQDIIVCSYDNRVLPRMMESSFLEISRSGGIGETMKVYMNYGEGRFVESAKTFNLNRSILTMGCNYGDLNNDGFEDFYLGTGEFNLAVSIPNRMFLNQSGSRFADVTFVGGFGQIQKGHGISFGDIDADGDQDVYHNVGGAVEGDKFRNMLFRNPGSDNKSVTIQLTGASANRFAVGARVVASINEGGKTRRIYKTIGTGGSFGNNSLQCELGIGKANKIDSLWVHWPDLKMQIDSFTHLSMASPRISIDQLTGINKN